MYWIKCHICFPNHYVVVCFFGFLFGVFGVWHRGTTNYYGCNIQSRERENETEKKGKCRNLYKVNALSISSSRKIIRIAEMYKVVVYNI